jgi:hypothetical protein
MDWTVTPSPDGQVILTAVQRRQFAEVARRHTGRLCVLSLRPRRAKRSLDQNAWIWGVAYPRLAEELGYDRHEIPDLHYSLVALWGGTHRDPRTGVEVPNKHSSALTTVEFGEFMEWLVRWAASEHGIVLTLPDERGETWNDSHETR